MAKEIEFDIDGFRQLPPDTQAAVGQAVSGLGQISAVGMADAASWGLDGDFRQ